jgi:hypothetical protein
MGFYPQFKDGFVLEKLVINKKFRLFNLPDRQAG